MRILLLVPRHFGTTKNSDIFEETSLPYYQAHNFWYKALNSLGHTVSLFVYSGEDPAFDYWSTTFKFALDKIALGNTFYSSFGNTFLPVFKKQIELLKIAKRFHPEIIILSGNTNNIFPKTLLQIKKRYNCKLVLLNGVSPTLFATQSEKILTKDFDYIFTNDFYHAIDWSMLGAKKAIALPVSAIDPEICKPYDVSVHEKQQFETDISFVGSLSPSIYRDRIELLEKLSDFNLKIWTYDKQTIMENRLLKKCYCGEASDVKMFKIFQTTKINLNFHGHTLPGGGNMRTFEIPGSKGFELVDRTNKAWYVIGKEMQTFHDIFDLRKKIQYYLKHERERQTIINAGYKRTIKDHTYRNRFKKLLKTILS